jgi:hypothetical protein
MKATERLNARPSREHDGLVGGQGDETELEHILNSIVVTCGDPARVLELFYWSQEPEVLEIIRSLMSFSKQSRELLCSFLTSVADPRSISVEIGLPGQLTLVSPEIAEAMLAMPYPPTRAG